MISESNQITELLSIVDKSIRSNIGKNLNFRFLIPNICKIYTYNEISNDIYGSNYFVEAKACKSRLESTEKYKLAISFMLFLASVVFMNLELTKSVVLSAYNVNSADTNINILLSLPLAVNIVSGTVVTLVADLIYIAVKYYNSRNRIHIDNIQNIIESFDRSLCRNTYTQIADDLNSNLEIPE